MDETLTLHLMCNFLFGIIECHTHNNTVYCWPCPPWPSCCTRPLPYLLVMLMMCTALAMARSLHCTAATTAMPQAVNRKTRSTLHWELPKRKFNCTEVVEGGHIDCNLVNSQDKFARYENFWGRPGYVLLLACAACCVCDGPSCSVCI